MAEVVKSKAQQEIEDLAESFKADYGFEKKIFPVTSTWASKLAHPCERWLYYLRTRWEDMQQRDWKGRGEKGNLVHFWWRQHVQTKGYTVVANETPLSEEIRRKFGIGGRIDGRVNKGNKRPLLYEFKGMMPTIYNQINTYDDLINHKKDYIKAYPAQLQTYLYDKNEEVGLFVLINNDTLEWKWIPVYLDYGYCEWLLQRAERIKKAYDANVKENPFPKIPYGSTCQGCEFNLICLPDIKNEGLEMIDKDDLLDLVKRRAALEKSAKEFKKLDEEAKDLAKLSDKSFLLNNEYKVEIKKFPVTRVDIKSMPIEVITPYEKTKDEIRISFVPLKKDQAA